MKLPAVAIAAVFASGIAFGLSGVISGHARSQLFVGLFFALALTSLLAAVLFLHYKRLAIAGMLSTICWVSLGIIGACIAQQPPAADHILSLVSAGKINLKSPLRYFGKLRDEPEKLPWGWGYEIGQTGVEYEGVLLPASGGLRLNLAVKSTEQALSVAALHAGDSISFLMQAKLPQVYRDEGAFDRRAYLSEQGIDLVATLRAPELLEVIEPGKRDISNWISQGRRRLRAEIDELWSNDANAAESCARCCWAIEPL
jgi:Domain of unknown function (DUF4131)